MPQNKKFFRKKSTAKKARRKGEMIVSYMGGFQLKKRKKSK